MCCGGNTVLPTSSLKQAQNPQHKNSINTRNITHYRQSQFCALDRHSRWLVFTNIKEVHYRDWPRDQAELSMGNGRARRRFNKVADDQTRPDPTCIRSLHSSEINRLLDAHTEYIHKKCKSRRLSPGSSNIQ